MRVVKIDDALAIMKVAGLETVEAANHLLQALSLEIGEDAPASNNVFKQKNEEEAAAKPKRATRKKTKPVEAPKQEEKEEVPESIEEPEQEETAEASEMPKAEEEPTSITIQHVRALLAKKVGDHRAAIKSKLTELGAPNVTKLGEEHYGDFVDFLNNL